MRVILKKGMASNRWWYLRREKTWAWRARSVRSIPHDKPQNQLKHQSKVPSVNFQVEDAF